jgi:hypothetical protein
MKPVAVLLGVVAASGSVVANAQIPLPASPSSEPAPTPAPSPTGPATSPGDHYFVEPAPSSGADAAPTEPPIFEPPPPGGYSLEPPPPPAVRHLAPERSLYLGARLGWFFPFGNAWARASPVSTNAGSGYVLEGVSWRDYVTSGPMFELNVGMRLSRSYALFALWERAQLGSGSDRTEGEPNRGESDFWAGALRASSNPDGLAFVTEVAVGYRRARSFYENGVEVRFTDAPFEARLGLGAELRTSRLTAWSALVTLGVGAFGEVRRVTPNGDSFPKFRPEDAADGHGWATLNIGGHFDLLPSDD